MMNHSHLRRFRPTPPLVAALGLLAAATISPLPSFAADLAPDLPGKAAIAADALRADPWVTPPRSAEETRARVDQLRAQYAPFLRSVPAKLDARPRQSLDGEWLSRFEITDSEDGWRPEPPSWFSGDIQGNPNWQKVLVPEWRWQAVHKPKQWQPWYPSSLIVWYRKHFTLERPAEAGQCVFLSFGGVDWEAEVWLNGKRLGSHVGYYEPFRFEVTSLLTRENELAVRVFDGPAFGEPISQWSILPFAPADKGDNQRYVMGHPELSIPMFKPGGSSSAGSGFGIHREVWLETTGEARVSEIFARGYPSTQSARVIVETDAVSAKPVTLEVRLLPENFEGTEYRLSKQVTLEAGLGRQEFSIPMPKARTWWPAEPWLYRCRVTLLAGTSLLDAHDALFGCREVSTVSQQHPRPGLQDGQIVLNGQPVFLRGTSVGGITNMAWYFGNHDRIVDIAMLLKAANFNAVRNNQHVAFPEVRELFDRLGLLSQQEQGSGYESKAHSPSKTHLAKFGRPLARVCYNNPGVILLSFMNEAHLDMTEVVAAVQAEDPERLMTPISGALFALHEPKYAGQLLGSFHRYDAWYNGVEKIWESGDPRSPDRNVMADFHDANPNPPSSFFPIMCPHRMNIVGEYGAEALDNYASMQKYPAHWGTTPALTDDVLWGAIQVPKVNLQQIFGFRGNKPANLGEYIEASQNYQTDVLSEATKGYRLSKKAIVGYYQYHFVDLTPANWPKSVLGHDLSPKKSYFEMAQINQPVVPLYHLVDRGAGLELWGANDLPVAFDHCKLAWRIGAAGRTLQGEFSGNLPADDATGFGRVNLAALPAGPLVMNIELMLRDGAGRLLSEYKREIYRSYKEVDESERSAKERAEKRAQMEKEKQAGSGKKP